MAQIAAITGVKQVLANLKRKDAEMRLKCQMGLRAAGLMLQGASQKLVPVDTGNLKASAFTRSTGFGFNTQVTVGYTANYALFVHEAVGMVLKGQPRLTKGKYWDPQGRAQAKFLEEPARRLIPQLRTIIKSYLRV